MKQVILGEDRFFGPWIADRAGGEFSGIGATIGLVSDTEVLAGVLFDNYNGANIHASIAAVPGRRWLTRDFLRAIFAYPFKQLGVNRITTFVSSANVDSQRFSEHLGFTREATLASAHPQGDLIIYVMHRKDCRWLTSEV